MISRSKFIIFSIVLAFSVSLPLILLSPGASAASTETESGKPAVLPAYRLAADSAVFTPIRASYTTPGEAARSLRQLSSLLRKMGDRRGLFPGVYSLTIAAAAKKLARREFANPRWVTTLIVNYANIYRRTLFLELSGQRHLTPVGWQLDFIYNATARNWSPDLDLIYAINVHIARDLIEALYLTPTHFGSPSVRDDFFRINDSLNEIMPDIWALFESYGNSFGLLPFLEQSATYNWVVRLRAFAWKKAKSTAFLSLAKRQKVLNQVDDRRARMVRDYGMLVMFF